MRNIFFKLFKVSFLAIVLSSGGSFAYAVWTPPTSVPPTGNLDISAMLNTSATTQEKIGGLLTGSFDSFQIKANHIPSFTVYQYTYDGNYPGATGAKTPLCSCATSASAIDCSTTTPLGELSNIGSACYDVYSPISGVTYSLKYNLDSTNAVMAGGSGSFDNSLTIGTVLSPGHIPSLNFITDATSGSFKIANDAGTLKFFNDLASPRLIIGQDGLLTVDLSGNTGVAGRNAIQINASSGNDYGTILVNKTDLSFWNSLGGTRAGIFAKNGDFDGTLGVTGATTLTGLLTANGGITTSGSVGIGVAAPSTGVKLDVKGGNVKMEAGLDVGGVLSSKGDIEVGDKISLSQNTSSITLRPAGAGVSIYTDPVVYGSTAPTSDPHDGNVELMTSCSGLTAVALKKDYGKLGGFNYYVRDVTCAVESGNYTIKNDANSLKFNNGSGATKLTLAQDGTLTANTLKLTSGAGAGKVLTSAGTDGSTSWQDGAVPAGTANGDTLRYDGTKWTTSTVITNNGGNIDINGNGEVARLVSRQTGGHTYLSFFRGLVSEARSAWAGFGSNGDTDFTIANEAGGDIVLLSGSGKVGIGTTAPSADLEVKGNFQIEDPVKGSLIVAIPGTSYATLQDAATHFNVGDSIKVVTTSNGFITGDIASFTGNQINFTNSTNSLSGSNGTYAATFYKDANLLKLTTSTGNPKLTIDKSGNVGIGGDITSQRWGPKYASWGGIGDGGAAIVNSNEAAYNALMVVGNNSADGSNRVVKVWDNLQVQGPLSATSGTFSGQVKSNNVNVLTAESDPTVYPWAKASAKPAYTQSEIGSGAVVATTGTFTGQVTSNSANVLTAETDPTVSTWAKAASKPTYTQNEIGSGALTATTGTFSGNVTASSFLYSSDLNLKKNIVALSGQLGKILQLRGVSFDWKKDGKHSTGLIAQEVEEVYPELVSTDKMGLKAVEYGNLVAPLIEAVKEQQKQIDVLKAEIENLKK